MFIRIALAIVALIAATVSSREALAQGEETPLRLGSLECVVDMTSSLAYPVGSIIRYDLAKNEITSKGFMANIRISKPEISRGVMGNSGIIGESYVASVWGDIPYSVAIVFPRASLTEVRAYKGLSADLIVGQHPIKGVIPDAVLKCGIEVTAVAN